MIYATLRHHANLDPQHSFTGHGLHQLGALHLQELSSTPFETLVTHHFEDSSTSTPDINRI